jgi:hypothetical protein
MDIFDWLNVLERVRIIFSLCLQNVSNKVFDSVIFETQLDVHGSFASQAHY